jgi:hypothetical protein
MNGSVITQISLTENHIAVLYFSYAQSERMWEVYETVNGIEMFSHYAHGAEALALDELSGEWSGRVLRLGVLS